jgi:hypothetical protein
MTARQAMPSANTRKATSLVAALETISQSMPYLAMKSHGSLSRRMPTASAVATVAANARRIGR